MVQVQHESMTAIVGGSAKRLSSGNYLSSGGRMNNNQAALLLHCFDLGIEEDRFEVAPGIEICRSKGSRVEALHEEISSTGSIDHGEPFAYGAYLLLTAESTELALSVPRDPHSTLGRACNIISIVTGRPIAMSWLIVSEDGFKTCSDTLEYHTNGVQMKFLENGFRPMDVAMLSDIKEAWRISNLISDESKASGGLSNVLATYYRAWHACYIEETCMELGVLLACLFPELSPEARAIEIAIGCGSGFKQALFKEFVEVYSEILLGFAIDENVLIDPTVEVFRLCSFILQRVLLDEGLARHVEYGTLSANDVFNGGDLERRSGIRKAIFGTGT